MNHLKALLQRLLAPLCAVLLLVAAFFPYKKEKKPLRVVPGIWPAGEALLVARDLGVLPPRHFQVIEISWASAVVRAFANGAADAAVVTLDNVIRMREAGQKLQVLMALSQSAGADALLAREGIQRLEDLKGKRVGVERGAGTYLLINALESAGMTQEDIEPVPMFQSEMDLALQNAQVDAVVVADPWLTKLVHGGMRSLYDSSQIKVPITYVLVASERACADSREELVSLLRVQAEMARKIWTENPFPGMEAVSRRERVDAKALAACLSRLRPLQKTESAEVLKHLPQMSQQMEAQLLRNSVIPASPAADGWFNLSFSEEAFR
jgi:NitT/TauT family transport system substrate-binding protein